MTRLQKTSSLFVDEQKVQIHKMVDNTDDVSVQQVKNQYKDTSEEEVNDI